MHLSPLARLLHSDGVPHHLKRIRSSWLLFGAISTLHCFFLQHDTPRISNPFIFHVETTSHSELSARYTLRTSSTSKERRSLKPYAHHIRPPLTLPESTPPGADKASTRLRMTFCERLKRSRRFISIMQAWVHESMPANPHPS